jgi:hypothetical protein
MDLQAVANGIATAFGAVTATNSSDTTHTTETATATADFPNQVTQLALIVYPPETSTLTLNMGRFLDDYDFRVKLLRDPLNMPGRVQWLYAWATALRPLASRKFTLGIAGVTNAESVDMRIAIEGETYASPANTPGGDLFDCVDITVRVQVFELATGVAP